MPVESLRQPISLAAQDVVAAARAAWVVCGEEVEVETVHVNGHACMASVAAKSARRIEFVVEDDDPDVWDLLMGLSPQESWQLCALVRLPLLGVAHERLRKGGYELQGWWPGEGRVQFGSIEKA